MVIPRMKRYSAVIGIPVVIALAAIVLGVLSPSGSAMPGDGLPVCNGRLACHRSGANAWIGLAVSDRLEVGIANQSRAAVDAEKLAVRPTNRSWGGCDYWLQVPPCQLSLWWVVGTCVVVVCVANAVMASRASRRGFPVNARPAGETGLGDGG